MEQGLKARLLASRAAAQACVPEVLAARSPEELHGHLRAYVQAKYLLDDDPEDGIGELTARSIAKALSLDRSILEDVDTSQECTNSTSAMRKRVLLLMAMQKDFGVELDSAATARTETLADLAALVFDGLHGEVDGGSRPTGK